MQPNLIRHQFNGLGKEPLERWNFTSILRLGPLRRFHFHFAKYSSLLIPCGREYRLGTGKLLIFFYSVAKCNFEHMLFLKESYSMFSQNYFSNFSNMSLLGDQDGQNFSADMFFSVWMFVFEGNCENEKGRDTTILHLNQKFLYNFHLYSFLPSFDCMKYEWTKSQPSRI